MLGFARPGVDLRATHVGAVANTWSYYCSNGNKYLGGMLLGLLLSVVSWLVVGCLLVILLFYRDSYSTWSTTEKRRQT